MITTDADKANARYVNADLHCHTNQSDGTLSVTEILDRAISNGVEILSITDHDTVSAYDRINPADYPEIKIVSGIELSTKWDGVGIHIVGLGFDLEKMKPIEVSQAAVRMKRAERIAQLFEKKGLNNALNKVLDMTKGAPPGRLHFAKLAVLEGLYATQADVFKKLLGNGKPGDVKSGWPELEQAVNWIVQAGGIAVIAHPHKYKMTNTKLKRLFQAFSDAGGSAIEVSGTGIDTQRRLYLSQLCQQFEFLGSRGSDFHSPGQSWCDLGRVAAIPDPVIPVWNYLEPL